MVLGVILFLVGAGATVTGVALMVIFGPDSTITSEHESRTTRMGAGNPGAAVGFARADRPDRGGLGQLPR